MAHNGIVYLLRFDRSYSARSQDIGWAQDLEQRLAHHRAGRGSPLIAPL
jgi:predicted GIY-YIG superfamily endonuclease